MTDHFIIPDVQWKPELKDNRHLLAAANYIVVHKPKRVICLGDFWDMPSLNGHEEKHIVELLRYKEDVESGNEQMQKFMRTVRESARKSKDWNPSFDFIMGNHEHRISRYVKASPRLSGTLSLNDLKLDYWRINDFLKIICLEGVHYSHYFANPFSGQPIGGAANNVLKSLGYSFTAGHKQILDVARMDKTNGEVIQGLIAGAFYLHDEDYKGQGNPHWRGVVHKRNVHRGSYDLQTIHINNLIKEYT
jgi:hypothetical protein